MSVNNTQVDYELERLITTKENLKNVIISNGGIASDNFSTYPAKFQELIEKKSGGGNQDSGILLPSVTNIQVDAEGLLTFDAPDLSDLSDYELVYLITVNETPMTISATSVNVKDSLINGDNTISIVARITFNDGKQEYSFEFEKETIIVPIVLGYTMPKEMYGTSAVVIGDNAYIFGGIKGSDNYRTILRQDLSTNVITPMEATLYTSAGFMSAVAIDGKAYIFGGYTSSGYYNYIQCYDPGSDTLTKSSTVLNRTLGRTSAVAIDGKAYIFGGESSSQTRYNYIQCYDPISDTLTKLSVTLPIALSDTSAVTINGKAYIFGGYTQQNEYKNIIICYDSKTNDVKTMNGMLAEGMYLTSAVVVNGKAYIFGGSTSFNIFIDYIQCYDPISDTCVVDSVALPYTTSGTSAVSTNREAWIYGGFSYVDGSWKWYNSIIKLVY